MGETNDNRLYVYYLVLVLVIQVRLEDGTVWLSQVQIADLFQTTVANINIHLKNIYSEGELNPGATIKENLIVQNEGPRQVQRKVNFYNLDVVTGKTLLVPFL